MSYTANLARATAILFLLGAVVLFATRDRDAYWAPLFAACFAGIVAATVMALRASRAAAAAADTASDARTAGA